MSRGGKLLVSLRMVGNWLVASLEMSGDGDLTEDSVSTGTSDEGLSDSSGVHVEDSPLPKTRFSSVCFEVDTDCQGFNG